MGKLYSMGWYVMDSLNRRLDAAHGIPDRLHNPAWVVLERWGGNRYRLGNDDYGMVAGLEELMHLMIDVLQENTRARFLKSWKKLWSMIEADQERREAEGDEDEDEDDEDDKDDDEDDEDDDEDDEDDDEDDEDDDEDDEDDDEDDEDDDDKEV